MDPGIEIPKTEGGRRRRGRPGSGPFTADDNGYCECTSRRMVLGESSKASRDMLDDPVNLSSPGAIVQHRCTDDNVASTTSSTTVFDYVIQ